MIGPVLSYDLGSHLGWALLDDGGLLKSGAHDFTHRAPTKDAEGRHGCIFTRAARWFGDQCFDLKPGLILYEVSGSAFKGEAARVALGLRAVMLVAAYSREILVHPVSSSAWQSWAKREAGWAKASHKSDQADAAWLGLYWFSEQAR